MIQKYKRGMAYMTDLGPYSGSTQKGRRPCIIVSNDIGNAYASIVTVVPCTTNTNKSQNTHYHIRLQENSVALCENIVTVDKNALKEFLGMMSTHDMDCISKCLKNALDLNEEHLLLKEDSSFNNTTLIEDNKEVPEMSIPEKIDKRKGAYNKRFISEEQKKQYLEDFDRYGPEYCYTKYNVASIGAARNRASYYKKLLTEEQE